ncbi:hypothetical protein ATK36_5575 [Amycolatopsis sulphurea]|uniref:Uncharacterized protein n=1 Tax=Amycolatopsis sulphurea TaxID=76022 RepID=A0A2A9FGT0_9PSEU|nr:hypothetical protein ATK36_5575 [Amycolatopsis sulphurea]
MSPYLGTSESRHVVPYAFESLFIMLPGPGGSAEYRRIEPPVLFDGEAESDEFRAPARRMAAEFRDGKRKTAVPFDRAAEAQRRVLPRSAPMTRIEHARLDIPAQVQATVYVRLHVVVPWVFVVCCSLRDQG